MTVLTFTLANQTDVGELSTIQTFASGSTGTMTSSGTALISTGAAFTLTLPTSTQIAVGQCVTVKNTTANGNITVTPPSGQIDGSATLVITAGASKTRNTVMWDGTNWWVVV